MSKKIPFTNKSKNVAHCGPKTIAPGETRMIDERDHPDYFKLKKNNGGATDNAVIVLVDVIKMNVKDIQKMISGFSTDDLNELKSMEMSGKNRESLVKSFNDELIKRAADDIEKTDLDSFAVSLFDKSIEELGELAVVHMNDAGASAAIEKEIDDRNQALKAFAQSLSDFPDETLKAFLDQYADQPAYVDAINAVIKERDSIE